MLGQLLEAIRLQPTFCANLLGVPAEQFEAWVDGRKPLPRYVVPELATVVGVSEAHLLRSLDARTPPESLTPAIWYKLRTAELTTSDREIIGVIRKLGFYIHQLDLALESTENRFDTVFARVRALLNRNDPPAVQGRSAAAIFREMIGISQTQTGVGGVLRGALRSIGLLVIESPLKESVIEGCCFEVGPAGSSRPCIFANSYRSTWFRRNSIIGHEVGHALCDLDRDPLSIDLRPTAERIDEMSAPLEEQRAQAFAQELLVPKSVLVQAANRHGFKWAMLTRPDIAQLIADTQVEQRTVLKASLDAGLITLPEFQLYTGFDCDDELRSKSAHALTTREFLDSRGEAPSPRWLPENRKVKVGAHTLRLPVGYVVRVLEALQGDVISLGKAAEMLFIDKHTFIQKFPQEAEPHLS